MKDFLDVRINELLRELEADVISLVKQLLSRFPDKSEEVAERLCLLSGISKERLEKKPINLTIQEIHSLCNVISFSASSIQDNELIENSSGIIKKWIDKVNYYYDCPHRIFNELVKRSNTGSPEEFLSTYHIFMDTSALCDENTKTLLDIIISELKDISKPLKVTVPKAVVSCLQDIAKDSEKNAVFRADEGLRNLKKIQEADLLSVRGDNADTTVMSTFLSAFSRFKPVYKMMLVTQDEALANAVEMLNTSGVEGAEILICKVSESNIIDFWFKNPDSEEVLCDYEALKTVSSFQLEESQSDSPDNGSADDEIETDIEKMSMLEEQLANMLGMSTERGDDSDDDELSDDDDFDTDKDTKENIEFDLSEEDTLIADAFDSDSWSVLD